MAASRSSAGRDRLTRAAAALALLTGLPLWWSGAFYVATGTPLPLLGFEMGGGVLALVVWTLAATIGLLALVLVGVVGASLYVQRVDRPRPVERRHRSTPRTGPRGRCRHHAPARRAAPRATSAAR